MKGRGKLYEGGYLMGRKVVKTVSFHSLLFVVSVMATNLYSLTENLFPSNLYHVSEE